MSWPFLSLVVRSLFVVVVRPSQSERLVCVKTNLTYNHPISVDIHTDLIYNHTGYDVTIYFQSEVIAKKCRKCRLRRLWLEFTENGLRED